MRRRSLLAAGTAIAAGVVAGVPARVPALAATPPPGDVWSRLAAGNARFAAGRPAHPRQDPDHREGLVTGQRPFACVLGCADSRVPAELVFDQGLGDLFTVRVVGQVLDDAVVGSVEYAVEHLAVRAVVVLGHARCGAVGAAIDLVRGTSDVTGSVSTVARAVEATVRATHPNPDEDAFYAACVRNQARRVAGELPRRSALVRAAVTERRVELIPAVYDLASGLVRRH